MDAVVVNYKTPGDLCRFVGSWLEHQPSEPWTLTIVDVEADVADTFVGQSLARKDPRIWHIWSHENIGYARACNWGSSLGKDAVLALFNADVEITPGSLDECSTALMSHYTWGVLGPRQVNRQGKLTHAGIVGSNTAPAHRGWQQKDTGQYDDVVTVPTVSGSAYFIKRECWDQLRLCPTYREVVPEAEGAFLPTPHYYEETWCSYHARAHGWDVVYYGKTTLIHEWHQASPVGGWAERQFEISRAQFRAACDTHGIDHD